MHSPVGTSGSGTSHRGVFRRTVGLLGAERARVVAEDSHDPSIVRIGAKVRFRDLATKEERDVVLVMPKAADISKGKVSVLTSVGVALIGLTEGHAISFTAPDGRIRSLRVIKVTAPPRGKGRLVPRTGSRGTSADRALVSA